MTLEVTSGTYTLRRGLKRTTAYGSEKPLKLRPEVGGEKRNPILPKGVPGSVSQLQLAPLQPGKQFKTLTVFAPTPLLASHSLRSGFCCWKSSPDSHQPESTNQAINTAALLSLSVFSSANSSLFPSQEN